MSDLSGSVQIILLFSLVQEHIDVIFLACSRRNCSIAPLGSRPAATSAMLAIAIAHYGWSS
jgi:hypothetical protein